MVYVPPNRVCSQTSSIWETTMFRKSVVICFQRRFLKYMSFILRQSCFKTLCLQVFKIGSQLIFHLFGCNHVSKLCAYVFSHLICKSYFIYLDEIKFRKGMFMLSPNRFGNQMIFMPDAILFRNPVLQFSNPCFQLRFEMFGFMFSIAK